MLTTKSTPILDPSLVTFQVNLSPGDIRYAARTVPALVQAHTVPFGERLAVVDCCRPQKTKIVDPELRFPEPGFSQRVAQITEIVETLKADGYLDRIVYLHPQDSLLPALSHKYLGNWVHETHDYGGCALMSYLAALELPQTPYVLHYDGDMLIHQSAGYDWVSEAIYQMELGSEIVAATPRTSPPFSQALGVADAPSLQEGRPYVEVEGGWLNDWFSTRCFLLDRRKLDRYLPLLQGRTLLDTLIRKSLHRGYPRSPEIMLFNRLGQAGGRRLNLSSDRAWLLHPTTKPPLYLELLPQIQAAVVQGRVPKAQWGKTDIDLMAWDEFLMTPTLV